MTLFINRISTITPLIILMFLSTASAHKKTTVQTDDEQIADVYKWLNTASEVTAKVTQMSFKKVDFSKFFQDALRAGMASVDAHSAFIKNYEEVVESTSGKFSGIGVSILSKSSEDETLIVTDVQETGPAYKAGLMSGDKIVEVNGKKLKGLSADEVIAEIKGPVGTKVKIKLIRKKKPLEFMVTRQVIKDQNSLCYHFKNQDIYYLSLKMFTESAARQMSDLLKKANKKQCKGIILDLRNNPGGILESGVEMASLFLDKGSEAVSTKTDPVLTSDLPIFVLINNFTASAAEILAGALKHYSEKQSIEGSTSKRKLMVFLLGTATYGKGSVQTVMPITNGCALKLTTMVYYLPEDISIQAVGISPDFTVLPKKTMAKEQKWIDELYGKETSLKHHITKDEVEAVIKGTKSSYLPDEKKKNPKKAADSESSDPDSEDEDGEEDPLKGKTQEERTREEITKNVQVQSAINMITMLNMAKQCNPALVSSRQKAIAFLKANYAGDDEIELEKVK